MQVALLIEQHGPAGTRDLLEAGGVRPEFHPVFATELLPAFAGELAKLEAEEAAT